MEKLRVGIIGATGMVGQRFALLLHNHPWFEVTALAASPRSAGLPYGEVMKDRWMMGAPLPESLKNLLVIDASDVDAVASQVDFVFSAVEMKKDEIFALEEAYARAECPVVSNNSAHRTTPDVPMLIPEVNHVHTEIIPLQRQRLGTKRGFIAAKSNCTIQSYVPALSPLLKYGLKDVLVCTYQAISGAGKTFETWPEIVDNIIPFVGVGEEEKAENEPLKIWGTINAQTGVIVNASNVNITAQCSRVPVADGHMAAVFMRFSGGTKPSREQIITDWNSFKSAPQELKLPSAPIQPLQYFEEEDFPQTRLHRNRENGMGFSLGRLRADSQYDYKFIGLSHNTLRGAAGGAVLVAELLRAKGYFGS
ncbi:MAG: aspartate-semialdehyde dehydrogenase [Oscillospiraceae bacterium]|nr:aspartate-semialdehyde dehydrogenase [Oscillospiraceae bacterium]